MGENTEITEEMANNFEAEVNETEEIEEATEVAE